MHISGRVKADSNSPGARVVRLAPKQLLRWLRPLYLSISISEHIYLYLSVSLSIYLSVYIFFLHTYVRSEPFQGQSQLAWRAHGALGAKTTPPFAAQSLCGCVRGSTGKSLALRARGSHGATTTAVHSSSSRCSSVRDSTGKYLSIHIRRTIDICGFTYMDVSIYREFGLARVWCAWRIHLMSALYVVSLQQRALQHRCVYI